ncbi:MAG: formylglycine-generating enzyme family protein [Sedimentisphaerales bacterium]|nr:formylglycine-generating enzyme family protein [Sedimentisphaerales bacterium]
MYKMIIGIILAGICAPLCCGGQAAAPSITRFPVDYYYQKQCELDYTHQSVDFIVHDLSEKYGIPLWIDIDLREVCLELTGITEQQVDEVLVSCLEPGQSWQREANGDRVFVGLSGQKANRDKAIELFRQKCEVKKVDENKSLYVDLKGRMSYGEAVGKLAMTANLGLTLSPHAIKLSRTGQKILSCTSAGPFYVYFSQDVGTNRAILWFLYKAGECDIFGPLKVQIQSVFVHTGETKTAVKGTFSMDDGIPIWTSDEPVSVQEAAGLSGVLRGPVLAGHYVILGLSKEGAAADREFDIRIGQHEPDAPPYLIRGANALPNPEQSLYRLHIESRPGLSGEDRAFFEHCVKTYYAGSHSLPRKDMQRYLLMKDRTPYIWVEHVWRCDAIDPELWGSLKNQESLSDEQLYGILEHDVRHGFTTDIYTEVYIKGVQDGNDVFPLGVEMRRYDPKDCAFKLDLPTVGDGDDKTKVRQNSIGMEFVWIPAGQFMMGNGRSAEEMVQRFGSSERYYEHGYPRHPVTLTKGFWMSRYEVTQMQYKLMMGTNPSGFKYPCPHCDEFVDSRVLKENLLDERMAAHPVDSVRYEDAIAFCTKLSRKEGRMYRLPTEAQWEYACRAGTTTDFYFGDAAGQLDEYAWYDNNRGKSTHPVGQKKPNAWGLYDMCGNVTEWCLDGFADDFYKHSDKVDPFNAEYKQGPYHIRVVRGGAVWYPREYCCSAFRDFEIAGMDGSDEKQKALSGFRIICESW